MKKQNKDKLELRPIDSKDLERIEKIWKINIAELRDEGLSELDDYPKVIEKIEASLQVVLDGRKKTNKKSDKISSKELAGPVLEIFKYAMVDIYRTHIENAESCKGMYA
ncbi:MAG: hypothetical protein WC788_01390 [Candidatus Paceibacterota bacterium]|jgi:hypothetical protein